MFITWYYKISNNLNDKVYINCSTKPEDTWEKMKDKTLSVLPDSPIIRIIKEIGVKNFQFVILFSKLVDDQTEKETLAELIDDYDCMKPNGYNYRKAIPAYKQTKKKQ